MSQEPDRSRVIGLKKVQQLRRNLYAPYSNGGMSAISLQILARPHQTITARQQAIGPIIRTPVDRWRQHRPLRRVVVQVGVAVDLILDRILRGEARLVGPRFVTQVLDSIRIASVVGTGEIGE